MKNIKVITVFVFLLLLSCTALPVNPGSLEADSSPGPFWVAGVANDTYYKITSDSPGVRREEANGRSANFFIFIYEKGKLEILAENSVLLEKMILGYKKMFDKLAPEEIISVYWSEPLVFMMIPNREEDKAWMEDLCREINKYIKAAVK